MLEREVQEEGLEVRYMLFDGDTPVFGGPHKTLISLDTIDDALYLRAVDPSGNEGYYKKDNSMAFGGFHAKIFTFTEINGRQYLRTVGTDGKEGLYDLEGNMFNNKAYDQIVPVSTPLDEIVLLIVDGEKQGFLLSDCSLFGKENAMQVAAELRKVGDEVCLWSADEEGKEGYHSREGEVLYGGRHKQTEIRKIGDEVCLLARDEEKKESLYSRECEAIYRGKHVKVSDVRKISGPDGKDIFLLEVYDEEGLVIVDRDGNKHFGDYHKAFVEGNSMRGLHYIDEEVLFEFQEFNEKICFFRYDNMPAFGGYHDEQCDQSEDGRMGPLVLMFGEKPVTALKFRDGHKIGYYSSDGTILFGGQHEKEISSFEWKGETYILFENAGKFRYFEFSGDETVFGEYHDQVKGILRVLFEKEEGGREDLLFLETLDPVSFGRMLKHFWSRPATFYSLEGETFASLNEIREHYGMPEDARFDPLIKTDSVIMPAIGAGKRDLEAVLASAQAEQGEEVPSEEGGVEDEIATFAEVPAEEETAPAEEAPPEIPAEEETAPQEPEQQEPPQEPEGEGQGPEEQ